MTLQQHNSSSREEGVQSGVNQHLGATQLALTHGTDDTAMINKQAAEKEAVQSDASINTGPLTHGADDAAAAAKQQQQQQQQGKRGSVRC
jgi:hypothetical protein